MAEQLKTSLGIWAFGPMVTRFVPGGHQPAYAAEDTVAKLRRAVDGLDGLIDDYEFHHPQELDETGCATRSTATASSSSSSTRTRSQR